jgi:hypothetical protein
MLIRKTMLIQDRTNTDEMGTPLRSAHSGGGSHCAAKSFCRGRPR